MKLMRITCTVVLVGLLLFSCTEPDTTAPTVSIQNPDPDLVLSEIVEIQCSASDESGIKSLELFINEVSVSRVTNSTTLSFSWNTTQYQDLANHQIKVLAIDENENEGQSEPLTVFVDQSAARPDAIDITTITYDTEQMEIVWQKSLAADFSRYELFQGLDTSNLELIATIQHADSTHYTLTSFNPLVENYFQITIYDTLELNSSGGYKANTLHDPPASINVIEVSYTLHEMTIQWEKYVVDASRLARMLQKSDPETSLINGSDFLSYELLHSASQTGEKVALAHISDIDSTVYTITEFDPTHENWFWIKLHDFWGLSSTGGGLSHEIDTAPVPTPVTSVSYDTTAMTITWDQSTELDFVAYELLYSESQTGEQVTLAQISDVDSTSYTITEFDPTHENWFWIRTQDFWGLSSTGSGMSHGVDAAPVSVAVTSVSYDTTMMTIQWDKYISDAGRLASMLQKTGPATSLVNGSDFLSYELLYSASQTDEKTLLAQISDVDSTTYTLTEFDPTHENWFWIRINDYWGLSSTGTGLSNEIDSAPVSVAVTSVGYDTTMMTIRWDKFSEFDFGSYEILHAITENGERTSISSKTHIDSTTYIITEFDPTLENWFWVRVNDFWGLASVGDGLNHEIDTAPATVVVTSVSYDTTAMTITWDQSTELDFAAYEILHSGTEAGERSRIALETNIDTTVLVLTDFDPSNENWYWIKVTDYWGLSAIGDAYLLEPDNPPTPASILDPLILSDSYTIGWTRNYDPDFESYKLYEWAGTDMANKVLLHHSTSSRDYFLNISDIRRDQELHYQVVTADYWGIVSESNIKDLYVPLMFSREYAEVGEGYGASIKITPDGGYIVAGVKFFGTTSRGTMLKVDGNGVSQWSQQHATGTFNDFTSINLTNDGGYILGGITFPTEFSAAQGWVIKTGANGVQEWELTIGDDAHTVVNNIKQTIDNGFIVIGSSRSAGTYTDDMFLMKLDPVGNTEWTQYYGDVRQDEGADVLQASDGGYIAVGSQTSLSDDNKQVWLVKTDSDGSVLWDNTYGGPREDRGLSINHTLDGGFIIGGVYGNYEYNMYQVLIPHDDAYILKVTAEGILEWEQYFGGSNEQASQYCEQTSDGGYILTGNSGPSIRDGQILIARLSPSGSIEWVESPTGNGTENAWEIHETENGGYILTGGRTQQPARVFIMKTDALGKVWLPLPSE